MTWVNMLKKELLTIRRSFDKAYPNLFNKIIKVHDEMEGYLQRSENIIVDLHSKLETEIPLDVIMDEIVMAIIEIRGMIEIDFDGDGPYQPLKDLLKLIPTQLTDAVLQTVMNALRFYGGYEFDDRTKVLTTFLKDLNVKILIKLLILGMYVVMQDETGKKVSKSKGVAVTAGKTKTVNMPIVEDDDNDCINRFERVCDNYFQRFGSIVDTKIKDLVSEWNTQIGYISGTYFGPKYKNKEFRFSVGTVEYEKDMQKDRIKYTMFSKDSLKLQFYFDRHYKPYLNLIRQRGVPDELICVIVKEFLQAFINGSTTRKEFMFQGKEVILTCAVERGVTNEHSKRIGIYFMHDGSFYSIMNFFVGFDRSHYSWEAYDNQEEHGEELWKRIAETEMDKFVRLLGGEFY